MMFLCRIYWFIYCEVGMKKEYNYCLRCGRKLKNPEARQLGYGSICYKKIKNKLLIKKLFI